MYLMLFNVYVLFCSKTNFDLKVQFQLVRGNCSLSFSNSNFTLPTVHKDKMIILMFQDFMNQEVPGTFLHLEAVNMIVMI